MIRNLRAVRRLLLGSGFTLGIYLTWCVGAPFVYRHPIRRARWRTWLFSRWGRNILRFIGVRLEIEGNPPTPPFYLVSNHLSYLDIAVLAGHVQAVFVSKAEVAKWPVIGFMCQSFDTIFIDRTSRRDIPRVLEITREALGRPDGVVIFPEGTSTSGESLKRFLPSLLQTPAQLGQEVSFALIHYSTPDGEPPAHLDVCWWGDMAFAEHVWRLLKLKSVTAKLNFGEHRIHREDRKELAHELHAAMLSRFTPVVMSETP